MTIGKGVPAIEERRNRPKMPPMLGIAIKAGPPKMDDAPPADPMDTALEAGGDYAAKLIDDITTAGASRGLSPEDSKAFAGDLMDAIAKCLRGGEDANMPPVMGADDMGEPAA